MQFETPARTILFFYQNPSGRHPRFETYTNLFPCHRLAATDICSGVIIHGCLVVPNAAGVTDIQIKNYQVR
jgi:hypothetical protein